MPNPNNPVFLFPGQGAQKVGMGLDLVEVYPDQAGTIYEQADHILGFPLSRLCFDGPEDELVKTENTQPALFVTSIAAVSVLTRHGILPSAAAGHSVGEYSALVAAGAVAFEDALPVVRKRGELMAAAAQRAPGAMAAIIGLDAEQVTAVCAAASEAGVVEPSNLNGPTQIVISGESAAIDLAVKTAEERGARVIRLKVSAPFHCSLMDPVREEFESTLLNMRIQAPAIPIVANATADYVRNVDDARRALLDQLSLPVRWTESMSRLRCDGYENFVEVGPGRVLAGLLRSIDRGATTISAGSASDIAKLAGRSQDG